MKTSTTGADAKKKPTSRALRALAFVSIAGCLAFSSAPAQADIITSLSGLAVADGTGGWLYTYTASLTDGQRVDPISGNAGVGIAFGTVYDFGPLKSPITATGLLATNFTFSTNLTNTPAAGTSPTDNSSLLNIRFVDTSTQIPANTFLGTFTANSPFGPGTTSASFDGQAAKGNSVVGNDGQIAVPTADAVVVPEPLSLALMCVGLFGLLLFSRRKDGHSLKGI